MTEATAHTYPLAPKATPTHTGKAPKRGLWRVALLVGLALCLPLPTLAQNETHLVLTTGPLEGTFFPTGLGIATLAGLHLAPSDGITVSPVSSPSSLENIYRLRTRDADLALTQGVAGLLAWNGRGPFQNRPQRHLRGVMVLWSDVVQVLLHGRYSADGDLRDLSHVRERSLAIGAPQTANEMGALVLLEALGYQPDVDFVLERLSPGRGVQALLEDRLSGVLVLSPIPNSHVTRAFERLGQSNLRLLGFSEPQMTQIRSVYPVWMPFEIPEDTYPNQPDSAFVAALPNLLLVHESVPDEVVYKLISTILAHAEMLGQISPNTLGLTLESATNGMPLPFHPGAVEYYQREGVEIPESLLP